MYDVAIIGGGPAGLTAAIYLGRAGKKTILFEEKACGGQIVNSLKVDNYPTAPAVSGVELAKRMEEQAKELGVEFEFEKIIKIQEQSAEEFILKSEDEEYEARAVIIATGAKNRRLGLEGEEQLIGKGVSYCATCDGAFYKNKGVVVVGGGDVALEDALYLSDIASRVYLVHRRDEFRGNEALVEELAKKSNVEFVLNAQVVGLIYDDVLKGVIVRDKAGNDFDHPINGLFVAIGNDPANDEFKDVIKLDENGFIEAGEDCKTNVDGVFVAGDNRTKDVRQVVTATSDGAIAAMQAIKYLDHK